MLPLPDMPFGLLIGLAITAVVLTVILAVMSALLERSTGRRTPTRGCASCGSGRAISTPTASF